MTSVEHETSAAGGTDADGPPATLQTSTTSSFAWVWSDAGSGAHRDVSIYRPEPSDGWFILGHYAHGDYDKPTGIATVVREVGTSERPLLVPPVHFHRVWKDEGSGGDHNGAIWYPQPPDGYVSLGYVAGHGYSPPRIEDYRCVALHWVQETGVGPEIWNDKGSGADEDVTLYPVAGVSGIFVAQGNYSPWAGTAYRLQS